MEAKPKCYVLVFDFRGVKNPPSSEFEIRVFTNEGVEYVKQECDGDYIDNYDCIRCYLDLTKEQLHKSLTKVFNDFEKDFNIVVRQYKQDVDFDSVYQTLLIPDFDKDGNIILL